MFFQSRMDVHGFLLPHEGAIAFNYGNPPTVVIELHPAAQEEASDVTQSATCVAWMKREPSANVERLFHAIEEDQLPHADDSFQFKVDDRGRVRGQHFVLPSGLPDPLESFATQIYQELRDRAGRTLRLLRWRVDSDSAHEPLSNLSKFLWSFDGKKWRTLPLPLYIVGEFRRPAKSTDVQRLQVTQMAEAGEDEPLAYLLWREAWGQKNSNPRSALVIGIAAAEIAVKHYIADVAPHARWVVENVQSPPIIRIIKDYLPTLPSRNTLSGKVLLLQAGSLSLLEDGVQMRNRLVHTGNQRVRREKVHDVLSVVHDLLRLLDFYRGTEWALAHVTEGCLRELLGMEADLPCRDDSLYTVPGCFQLSDWR